MNPYESFHSISGQRLDLKKLKPEDIPEIISSLYSPSTWIVASRSVTKDKLPSYLENYIAQDSKGESLSLVARLRSTNEIVGFTTYFAADKDFAKIEIGSTWIADKWMRTFVNTEKNFLMLKHAFEAMNVKRVQFSVDPINEKSNKAMLGIGARFEGTLRKWRPPNAFDQGHRNMYSICDDE